MILRNRFASSMDLVRLLVLGWLLAASGIVWAASAAVGEVSFAIGVARLIDRAGRVSAVERGTPVHAGDRIETEQGGHVHIRFIDGAFVSVRPASRLIVETYRYDTVRPDDSAIRLKLEQGVARSISGKGAESARERFRLNTPIAAIGVKGTDFVVLAEAERVRVAVHSGAIVLTPFGAGCSPEALGPCDTAATRLLSADMGRVMLELERRQGVPQVVPMNGTPSPDRSTPPLPQEPAGAGRGVKTSGEANTEVLAVQAVGAVRVPVVSPPPAPPLPPPTLVWGRWWAQAWPGDHMSLPFAEARGDREVTVGNDQYALFRPALPLSELVPNLGRVDFTLRDAQAHLVRGGMAEAGRVDGGWLSVDFSARRFATGLTMSHPQAGAASLEAAGNIRGADGMFVVRNADGLVRGALTLDGKEAGYVFERPVPEGTFVGITRWSR
ncbi:MAG: FecR family protein [Pseudomonadota bacterium]